MKTNSLCFMILLLLRISHHARSEPIDSSNLPFLVSIWFNEKLHCGGIIYDSKHVITTTGCVQGIPPDLLIVLVKDMMFPYFNEMQYSVKSYVTHPSYRQIGMQGRSGSYTIDDIAVITLVNPFLLRHRLRPASFKQSGEGLTSLLNRRPYKYVGWTRPTYLTPQPLVLHVSNVTLDRHGKKEDTHYTAVLPDIYSCGRLRLTRCLENRGTPILAQTDSSNSEVIAILTDLSFIPSDAILGTFLKVRKYMTWIQQTIERNPSSSSFESIELE
ncbi:uncharacterized protein [Fopius arisanus]|uniref:Peptidase S1 domain-containing protein n=1 Tax=Fopius arisanus TaxID=64838 RepID=A0A9R1TD33_9HYME|nr:PREDICTED: uncharacterized protein LOC105268802 [Fopius arisanus]XP_011306935.1 PREDICTED: uncharacterized protein LOC105268802 [Fopius arisanus]XP_011306936.1 PREDICTED: uncharacterized protein LOC105268802 [Fopius arisanus]